MRIFFNNHAGIHPRTTCSFALIADRAL